MHFVSGREGGNEIILEVYIGQTLLCISKRFPENENKRKWPKITASVETYTFRNNSGTLAASYRKKRKTSEESLLGVKDLIYLYNFPVPVMKAY
jgi:hypothetical protein